MFCFTWGRWPPFSLWYLLLHSTNILCHWATSLQIYLWTKEVLDEASQTFVAKREARLLTRKEQLTQCQWLSRIIIHNIFSKYHTQFPFLDYFSCWIGRCWIEEIKMVQFHIPSIPGMVGVLTAWYESVVAWNSMSRFLQDEHFFRFQYVLLTLRWCFQAWPHFQKSPKKGCQPEKGWGEKINPFWSTKEVRLQTKTMVVRMIIYIYTIYITSIFQRVPRHPQQNHMNLVAFFSKDMFLNE